MVQNRANNLRATPSHRVTVASNGVDLLPSPSWAQQCLCSSEVVAGIHIITLHKVLRVAVTAVMKAQTTTTTQDVFFVGHDGN